MRTEFRYGQKIKQAREAREWTQQQLAEAADLDTRTIQRVEADATQGRETLQAIAGALNAELASLRTTWRIAESRLIRKRLVTTYDEFVRVEQAYPCHTAYKPILAPLMDARRKEIEKLVDQVFDEREMIDHEDGPLWRSYLEGVEEPLETLFGYKFAFFLLDEERDLLLRSTGGLTPSVDHIPNWTVRYYSLVPRHGCFRLGRIEPLHRFNEDCRTGADTLFRVLKQESGLHVFAHALFAVTNSGDENAVCWCDTCFPRLQGGARISFEYIEQVTGMKRAQLHALCDAVTGQPFIEGLA